MKTHTQHAIEAMSRSRRAHLHKALLDCVEPQLLAVARDIETVNATEDAALAESEVSVWQIHRGEMEKLEAAIPPPPPHTAV